MMVLSARAADAPLPSGAAEFDLAEEAAEEGTSKRKTYGPYIIIYSLIGVGAAAEGVYYLLFVDHSLSDRLTDVAWIAAGAAIITWEPTPSIASERTRWSD